MLKTKADNTYVSDDEEPSNNKEKGHVVISNIEEPSSSKECGVLEMSSGLQQKDTEIRDFSADAIMEVNISPID
jgi:hypothetical protein